MDGKKPIPSGLIGLFIIMALQIGGFALLWSKDAPSPEYIYLPATVDKTSTASPTAAPVVVVSPPDEKALRQIIQAVLEQELAPYAHRTVTPSETAQKMIPIDPPGAEENSPANIQALNEASNIIDDAIGQGQWTIDASARLLAHASQLTFAQRRQLMDRLMRAVNSQELEMQTPAPAL